MSEACEHQHEHQGEVCWPSEHPRPGTGARDLYYATAFYCTKCCAITTTNVRIDGNTYGPVKFGAVRYEKRPS